VTNTVFHTRILIVDDDERYLSSLRRALRGNFNIVTTKDPVQALKIIEYQGPFAVVISDFQMPFINGVELFSRIVAIDKNIQRIMLTGCAELQMAIDAVNHGKITAFLTKPTPIVTIRSVVLDAIRAYQKSIATQLFHSKNLLTKQNISHLCSPLTIKEKEILSFVAKGLTNAEISKELTITVGTVKCHLNNLFSKLDVHNRTKVVAKGLELGLITSDAIL
jgi:DNA-binding NarL/FixJ family response regulator